MRLIITNNTINYEGFLKLRTLEEALKTLGDIDVLVYHKSNEPVEKKVEYLTKIRERVHTLVYVRNREAMEQAIQMIVLGSKGKYFDDEFFIESGNELSNLVSNLDEVTQLAELGGVGILSDFFSKYLNKGSSGFNKSYLNIVKTATSGMIAEYRKKDMELIQMSETATELFSSTMQILSGVEEEKIKLQESVKSLEDLKEKGMLNNSTGSTLSSVYFFPRVSYLKEKPIIRIKELGSVPYLTSFILGFRLYLERIKYTRAKVIFLYPVGDQYESQYKQFVWISQQNCRTMRSFYVDVVFVNYPNKEVLSRLLDDDKHEVFIVVDRTKLNAEHLLNAKGLYKYAISGSSILKSFTQIKAKDCISPQAIIGSMTRIKPDSNYPTEADQRERYYLREYSACYDSLYSVRRV